MALFFDEKKCTLCGQCVESCPFNALSINNGRVEVGASCKMCRLCLKKCPEDAVSILEDEKKTVDKNAYKGVMVYVELDGGHIHPVVLELIGKARELAAKVGHPVYAVCVGGSGGAASASVSELTDCTSCGSASEAIASEASSSASEVISSEASARASEVIGSEASARASEGIASEASAIAAAHGLLAYGVDKVFVYSHEALSHFRVDVYANVIADCIQRVKPSVVLVGATSVGRSLAPRLATRFRTGLTADCTQLEMKENTDLVQIRPAFGGNIMAQIITPNTRPQFATVRYKVMDRAHKVDQSQGEVVVCDIPDHGLDSGIRVLKTRVLEKHKGIEDEDVLVVAGKGVKTKKDLEMLEQLALALGGQLASTRPLVESGWTHYTKQIGLSGRTVKPKLIITCGVSGAIQFTAGMNGAECIVAINTDPEAPIFKIANYCIVDDLYNIIPGLLKKVQGKESEV